MGWGKASSEEKNARCYIHVVGVCVYIYKTMDFFVT